MADQSLEIKALEYCSNRLSKHEEQLCSFGHIVKEISLRLTSLENRLERSMKGPIADVAERTSSLTIRSTKLSENSVNLEQPLRILKFDLPRFHGEDAQGWVSKAEQFFDYHETPDLQRLEISSLHIDGDALQWYQLMFRNCSLLSWQEFRKALLIKFSSSEYRGVQKSHGDRRREELITGRLPTFVGVGRSLLPPAIVEDNLVLQLIHNGIMSKGSDWIITNGMTNMLSSLDAIVIDAMKDVLGVKTYVLQKRKRNGFRVKWKMKFLQDNPALVHVNLNVCGLWAYDVATALVVAIEKVGGTNFSFKMTKAPTILTDLDTLRVSQNGEMLRDKLLNIRFRGFIGEYGILNGQLQVTPSQIINEKGNLEYSTSKNNQRPIIWLGRNYSAPKGWQSYMLQSCANILGIEFWQEKRCIGDYLVSSVVGFYYGELGRIANNFAQAVEHWLHFIEKLMPDENKDSDKIVLGIQKPIEAYFKFLAIVANFTPLKWIELTSHLLFTNTRKMREILHVQDAVAKLSKAILSVHQLVKNAHECMVLDNEVLYDNCIRILKLTILIRSDLSHLISSTLSRVTCYVRVLSQLDSDFKKLIPLNCCEFQQWVYGVFVGTKQTGLSEGYGFMEFFLHATTKKVLQNCSAILMPNTEQSFHLNWATFSMGDKRSDNVSIVVGDLAADVTDSMLRETFSSRYPSVKAAKVVFDANTSCSKGYGFVRFRDDNVRTHAMNELNGVYCSSGPRRVGVTMPLFGHFDTFIFACFLLAIRASSFLSNDYTLEASRVGFLFLSTLYHFALEVGLLKTAATSVFMKEHTSCTFPVTLGPLVWKNITEVVPLLVLIRLAFWLYKFTRTSSFKWSWTYVIQVPPFFKGFTALHWRMKALYCKLGREAMFSVANDKRQGTVFIIAYGVWGCFEGSQHKLELQVKELRKFTAEAEQELNYWILPVHSACYSKFFGQAKNVPLRVSNAATKDIQVVAGINCRELTHRLTLRTRSFPKGWGMLRQQMSRRPSGYGCLIDYGHSLLFLSLLFFYYSNY